MAVFSWRVSILQRPHLGEVLPDQQGRSDRQFPSDPAIGNCIGGARSRGPLRSLPSGVVSIGLHEGRRGLRATPRMEAVHLLRPERMEPMAHRPKLLLSTLRLILSDMIVGGRAAGFRYRFWRLFYAAFHAEQRLVRVVRLVRVWCGCLASYGPDANDIGSSFLPDVRIRSRGRVQIAWRDGHSCRALGRGSCTGTISPRNGVEVFRHRWSYRTSVRLVLHIDPTGRVALRLRRLSRSDGGGSMASRPSTNRKIGAIDLPQDFRAEHLASMTASGRGPA